MAELNTEPAELHFTIEIKRKDTGKIETFDMIGHVIPNPEPEIIEETKE